MANHTDNRLTRRAFIGRTAALGVTGVALPAWMEASDALPRETALLQTTAAPPAPPIDLAEWSYFWVGVEHAELARGTVVNGTQMYVEYMIPAQVRHPYSIVLEHGGGGQGLDWMETPDGRPGWWTYFVQAGFKVYVIDRPGHGRSPFHPDLHGAFPQRATAIEGMERMFTAPEKAQNPYGPQARLHTQWPGTGTLGDPTMDQVASGQGGSFLQDLERTHAIWQQRAAELLDTIGPAVIFTHSMGGPFGWLAGDIRPNLVKGIVGVEPAGPPFGNLRWGLTASKVTYDPPVSDPSELKTVRVTPSEPNRDPYLLQAEPARKLKNLVNIPIALVTSEASYHVPYDANSVAFLKQAGCTVEHIVLAERGIHGNAHFMMMEKNNREVLQPILDWIATHASPKNVQPTAQKRIAVAGVTRKPTDSSGITIAGHGHFWVGTEHKPMPYGTIVAAQMYVQYLIPSEVRHPVPVVLVHGGGGSMLHYMGVGDGMAGWAHYYVQAGYRVYLVDRPGHGRAPYHPDALGPIGGVPMYAGIAADLRRAAAGPNRQWPGTGDIGDPLLDQIMAGQNAAPQDQAMAHGLWATRGAELLDRIGPAILQTHSAGGPFGWLVADRRPNLVKAIVCVEGAGTPFAGQAAAWGLTDIPLTFDPLVSDPKQIATRDVTPPEGSSIAPYKLQADPARKLKNLQNIPIVVLVAEQSGRRGEPSVEFLKQAGCAAELLDLKDRGVRGNGHFMMLENNRRQVFDVIRAWIEARGA